MGKILLIVGLAVAVLGGCLMLIEWTTGFKFGRLPGDVNVQRDGFSLHFPIVTMLILSVVVSLVLMIVAYLRR